MSAEGEASRTLNAQEAAAIWEIIRELKDLKHCLFIISGAHPDTRRQVGHIRAHAAHLLGYCERFEDFGLEVVRREETSANPSNGDG